MQSKQQGMLASRLPSDTDASVLLCKLCSSCLEVLVYGVMVQPCVAQTFLGTVVTVMQMFQSVNAC